MDYDGIPRQFPEEVQRSYLGKCNQTFGEVSLMDTIHVQLALTINNETAQALAKVLGPAIRQALGLQFDEQREARIQRSQNANFRGQKLPEDQGLLVDSRQAAKLLKVSTRTLWTMQNSGAMPPPIRIGRAVRWSQKLLEKWIEAGCPHQNES